MLRIATCRPLPEPDPDENLLLAALAARGVAARMVAWDDTNESWETGATLIRSTWDYVHHLDQFLRWIDRAARGLLWNPAAVLRDNVHKSYLLRLAAAGVAVTPTVLATRGSQQSLPDLVAAARWHDVVVKPAVGAGSFATHRLQDVSSAESRRLFDELLAQYEMLIQPYLESVEGHGERALVWIDGAFTHAVRKTPRFAADVEVVSEALPIAADERVVAEQALAAALAGAGGGAGVDTHDLLYARVDVARDARGRVVVMELELVEPSLFLLQSPLALERFVTAIAARLA